MNWKMRAIEDLRHYKFMKLGIINSKERLANIDSAIKPLLHMSKKRRTRKKQELIDAVKEADRLRQNISSAESVTTLVERALESLTELERDTLDKFYIDNNHKPITVISDELGCSERSLYRIRHEALEKFTLAMYGTAAS